jgi:hypothetical protein
MRGMILKGMLGNMESVTVCKLTRLTKSHSPSFNFLVIGIVHRLWIVLVIGTGQTMFGGYTMCDENVIVVHCVEQLIQVFLKWKKNNLDNPLTFSQWRKKYVWEY